MDVLSEWQQAKAPGRRVGQQEAVGHTSEALAWVLCALLQVDQAGHVVVGLYRCWTSQLVRV